MQSVWIITAGCLFLQHTTILHESGEYFTVFFLDSASPRFADSKLISISKATHRTHWSTVFYMSSDDTSPSSVRIDTFNIRWMNRDWRPNQLNRRQLFSHDIFVFIRDFSRVEKDTTRANIIPSRTHTFNEFLCYNLHFYVLVDIYIVLFVIPIQ